MIEQALRDSARDRFPVTPPIADAVLVRLPSASNGARGRSRRRRTLVVAIAALALAGTALAASALDLVPGVRIERVNRLPDLPFAQAPVYGERSSLAEARVATPFEITAPTELGNPDDTYLGRDRNGSPVVTLVYGEGDRARLVLTQWEAQSVLFDKLLTPDTSATYVDVHGAPGIWIEGGDHAVFFFHRGDVDRVGGYLVGNVLVWQRGRVTYRLELGASRDHALELAASLRPTG